MEFPFEIDLKFTHRKRKDSEFVQKSPKKVKFSVNKKRKISSENNTLHDVVSIQKTRVL